MQEPLPAIWPPFEAFYIRSMLFNSTSAVRSIVRLEKIFDRLPKHFSTDDLAKLPSNLILNELQNVVREAGALSRYFWPARKGHDARCQILREAFQITHQNPLQNRDLRNALEHFDEKMDKYFSNGAVGVFIPEYVGTKPKDDGVPSHFFRAYFVDSGSFRLLDQEFDIKPLANELIFVHETLVDMDANGGRLKLAKRDA